eukprot:6520999-Prymnesium_polylepis.1
MLSRRRARDADERGGGLSEDDADETFEQHAQLHFSGGSLVEDDEEESAAAQRNGMVVGGDGGDDDEPGDDDAEAEARYEAQALEGGHLDGALGAPAQPDDTMSAHELGEDDEEEQESLGGFTEDGAEGEAALSASGDGGRGGDGEPSGGELPERPARRQRINPLESDAPRLGERPANLAAPVDTLSYQPTLTPLVEQEGSFHDTIASFNRIYGSRCIDRV